MCSTSNSERSRNFQCDKLQPWGYVVLTSAFLIQFLTFGTTQSIGVYNIEFLYHFQSASTAAISLVGSISLGVVLGTGPLASMLMTRWSHRQVALLGACLCNAGLIVMPFAPNLEYMYAFYGVLAGLGYCLVYVPSHVLCGLYFKQHSSLATGIATAGSGTGAALFPIIIYHIIDFYGWRGSFYIVAGVNLHLFVLAGLLRPVGKTMKEDALELEELQSLKKDVSINDNDCETASGLQDFEICSASNGGTTDDGKKMKKESFILNTEKNQLFSIIGSLKKHFTSIFKWDFIIYLLSNVCWNAGGAVILIFLAEYAHSVGLSKEKASKALTLEGVGACFGCVLGGILGNIKYFNRSLLFGIGNLSGGVLTLLIPWKVIHTLEGILMISVVLGLHFGVVMGLLVVITADLLGAEALGDGFGYVMLANGVGVLGGPPLAGLLMDAYRSQDFGFYLSGVLTGIGGVLMISVFLWKKFNPLCGT